MPKRQKMSDHTYTVIVPNLPETMAADERTRKMDRKVPGPSDSKFMADKNVHAKVKTAFVDGYKESTHPRDVTIAAMRELNRGRKREDKYYNCVTTGTYGYAFFGHDHLPIKVTDETADHRRKHFFYLVTLSDEAPVNYDALKRQGNSSSSEEEDSEEEGTDLKTITSKKFPVYIDRHRPSSEALQVKIKVDTAMYKDQGFDLEEGFLEGLPEKEVAMCDTGAEKCIIPAKVFKKLKLPVFEVQDQDTLECASASKLDIRGAAFLTVTNAEVEDAKPIRLLFYVAENLKHTLLSLDALKEMKIVSKEFPKVLVA